MGEPPKGIDPKVWEMAVRAFNKFPATGLFRDTEANEAIEIISRLIMEEREECAKIADPIHCDGRMSDYEKQAFDIRDVISQAIRNRSNTTTERNEV